MQMLDHLGRQFLGVSQKSWDSSMWFTRLIASNRIGCVEIVNIIDDHGQVHVTNWTLIQSSMTSFMTCFMIILIPCYWCVSTSRLVLVSTWVEEWQNGSCGLLNLIGCHQTMSIAVELDSEAKVSSYHVHDRGLGLDPTVSGQPLHNNLARKTRIQLCASSFCNHDDSGWKMNFCGKFWFNLMYPTKGFQTTEIPKSCWWLDQLSSKVWIGFNDERIKFFSGWFWSGRSLVVKLGGHRWNSIVFWKFTCGGAPTCRSLWHCPNPPCQCWHNPRRLFDLRVDQGFLKNFTMVNNTRLDFGVVWWLSGNKLTVTHCCSVAQSRTILIDTMSDIKPLILHTIQTNAHS